MLDWEISSVCKNNMYCVYMVYGEMIVNLLHIYLILLPHEYSLPNFIGRTQILTATLFVNEICKVDL